MQLFGIRRRIRPDDLVRSEILGDGHVTLKVTLSKGVNGLTIRDKPPMFGIGFSVNRHKIRLGSSCFQLRVTRSTTI